MVRLVEKTLLCRAWYKKRSVLVSSDGRGYILIPNGTGMRRYSLISLIQRYLFVFS